MSGSMGFGKVHLLAHELVSRLENGEQAVIICGNNKKRMRSLRLQFHKNPNVHIIGFTRHVAEYMAAADVLFTKPGGLSSTEALCGAFRSSTLIRFRVAKQKTVLFLSPAECP